MKSTNWFYHYTTPRVCERPLADSNSRVVVIRSNPRRIRYTRKHPTSAAILQPIKRWTFRNQIYIPVGTGYVTAGLMGLILHSQIEKHFFRYHVESIQDCVAAAQTASADVPTTGTEGWVRGVSPRLEFPIDRHRRIVAQRPLGGDGGQGVWRTDQELPAPISHDSIWRVGGGIFAMPQGFDFAAFLQFGHLV